MDGRYGSTDPVLATGMSSGMPFPEPETTLAATIVTEDEERASIVAKSRVLELCKKIYEFSIAYTQAQ